MKTVNDVLSKAKGTDKVSEILTGKGGFSKTGFGDLTSALVNDTTFRIPTFDKDGKKTGDVSVSELVRNDLKKTLAKANYPQKSEAAILDSAEITTTGLAEAIPYIVMQQIACGKKFDLPQQPNVCGSIYLANVPGKTKTSTVRDIKTKQPMGTTTVTTKDSIQIRAKSPVPASCIVSKVRKDVNGKVVNQ